MASGRSRLAAVVALAYTLAIVYASLQPFTVWRMPSDEVLGFLTAPWPRYITALDVMFNVVAYLPFGCALFIAMRPRLSGAAAFVMATTLGALLSLALEGVQMFLPARIASNLDLLTNVCGAASGALLAWTFTLPRFADSPLAVMRRATVRGDAYGDCGLLIVTLWVLIQYQAASFAMAHGDLRDVFEVTPLFEHTASSYLLAEASVVALAITAIGLVISMILLPSRVQIPLLAIALVLAFAAKSLAVATMVRASSWLQWFTPGVALGSLAGIALLAILSHLPHMLRAYAGIVCLVAGTVIVNASPGNPYHFTPIFMLGPQPRHLINLNHIIHALSQLWPLFAALFLLASARAQPHAADR